MRNWTRILLLLLIAAMANLAPAQNHLAYPGNSATPGVRFESAGSNLRQLAPGQSAPAAGLVWSPALGYHHPPSALMTSTCGPDTLLYPLAKATGLRVIGFNDSVATSQWYDAPQPITVRGASFYAWVDSATSATVTLVVRLFNAGPDSLPIGAPLASASIIIDSSFSPGTLAFLEKSVAFPVPVVVTAPYLITIENNSPIVCGTVSNNYNAGDGAQEWLGSLKLPAPTVMAWIHGYDIQVGPTTFFDADNLIYPHVTYDITASYTANPLNGCAPLAASFTNTSSPVFFSRFYNFAAAIGNPDSSFNWTYGNGAPVQQIVNGSATYVTPGIYNVTLRDSIFGWRMNSCVDVGTGVVNVGAAPTAGFTSTIIGSNAAFTSTSVGAVSYSWNFGDGSPVSTLQNPTHTYAAAGTYNVCLTVTNPCGSATTCSSLTAGCPPLVAAFLDSIQGLSYGVADVSTGSTVTSWLWDFGDGTTATTPQATHTYAVAGVYTVCLTVGNGCSFDTTCITVVIGCPIPIANWSFITTGQTVVFTDLSTNLPATWVWDFGNGAPLSTVQNPTHVFTVPGPFVVCMIAASTCGADTLCQTVVAGCNTPIANFSSTTSNLVATFTDLSTNGPTSWSWDFGDGSALVTTQNPAHTYTAPGTYNVCLTSTSTCGTTTFCTNVTVTCPAPVVGFSSAITGLTANFTNSSINATSFAWTFGDGGTSTLQNPSHTYAASGSYQVCLTATSACGSATQCSTVVLNCPTPATNFSFTNINLNYSFTSLATGNPTSYFWTFGDGATSTLQNPTHLYSNVGTFQVCLIATNACGADTFCIPVTVSCQGPSASFNQSANNLTVAFTNSSTGNPTTYQWDFGDGSGNSIQTNPTYTYTSPGTYNVCLTAINSCGSQTTCVSVTVGCAAPTSNFNFLTVGNVANFANSSTAATTFSWNFGDGNSSTLQNPSHTYGATGTFNVCLIASSVCGADTFCRQVIVTCVPPAANFSFVVSSDSVASFTNQASPNSTSWVWNFGDGSPVTSTANPVHVYQAPGTYTVCLEVINTCGRDTICQNVTITCVNPTSGYTTQVTNAVANFISLSLNATTYFWDFGDGYTSTLQNPSHAYTASGIFTACLTVSNFCGSNTSCQNLVIACNAPQPSFNAVNGVNSVNLIDQSINFPTRWFWNFGDGGTDTLQNPNHVFLFPGQYYVCLTAINSCGANTLCQWINVTAVNVPEASLLDQSFQVYPNPSDGQYTLSLELPRAMDIRVRVLNMLGQEIVTRPATRVYGTYTESLDLSELAAGTYHLELSAGEAILHRALIKR